MLRATGFEISLLKFHQSSKPEVATPPWEAREGAGFFPRLKATFNFQLWNFCSLSFFKDPKKVVEKLTTLPRWSFFLSFFTFYKQKPENLKGFESFFQVARSSEASEQPKVSFRCLGYVYIYMGWNTNLLCGDYNKSLWGSLGIWCNGLCGKIIYVRWVA